MREIDGYPNRAEGGGQQPAGTRGPGSRASPTRLTSPGLRGRWCVSPWFHTQIRKLKRRVESQRHTVWVHLPSGRVTWASCHHVMVLFFQFSFFFTNTDYIIFLSILNYKLL